MTNKYLLCRPQGGLNDMLCQIEKCCRYAELTSRTVIVDTAYAHSDYFRDKFSRYFSSRQRRLFLTPNGQVGDLDAMQVFPEFLQGRLNSYETSRDNKHPIYCDTATAQPITFNFNQNYAQPLLVHHQEGGGRLSGYALLRLTLTRSLLDELISRIKTIGGPWVGVHVRNTDYSTDYELLLNQLKQTSVSRIFLATDSLEVKSRFESELKNTTVYSFSNRLSADGKPVHFMRDLKDDLVFNSNCDAILDLVMLGLSQRLLFQKIQPNEYGASYSGYALLAQHLYSARIVLRHLISDPRIRLGLD